MDTKKLLGPWSSKIDYIKINYKEFKENNLSETINDKSKYKNIITTIGKDGAFLITQDGARFHAEQTKSVAIRDVSGAGDTYLAALVIHFMHHKNILNAMRYANSAAAVAVSKRGVVSVHFSEVD